MTSGKDDGKPGSGKKVGLFVTCLVDLYRPSVGFSAVKLLEEAGCTVIVPATQTCCGQPAYNSGDQADARTIARQVIEAFTDVDYVVVPSGSCAGTISQHYPTLFKDDEPWAARARKVAAKTFELVSFLTDVLKLDNLSVSITAPEGKRRGPLKVTYHDSCSGLRELNIKSQPRSLLNKIGNLELVEMQGPDECCGFGGTFCVKYPEVSGAIVDKKIRNIRATDADMLLAGDLGCLLNMGGRIARTGQDIEVRHVAEVLAGDFDTPPLVTSISEKGTKPS